MVVGMIAYAIVGVLYSIGVLNGKKAGSDAYALVFFLLILAGYAVYKRLVKLKLWIISWPLIVKIIVPSILILLIISIVVCIYVKHKKEKHNYE